MFKKFDGIYYKKLLHIMEKADISELERNCIKALYWNQYVVMKTEWKVQKDLYLNRGTARMRRIINIVQFAF